MKLPLEIVQLAIRQRPSVSPASVLGGGLWCLVSRGSIIRFLFLSEYAESKVVCVCGGGEGSARVHTGGPEGIKTDTLWSSICS